MMHTWQHRKVSEAIRIRPCRVSRVWHIPCRPSCRSGLRCPAGAGMGERLPCQNFDGFVVCNFAVYDRTAVAMCGVFAVANIGDDIQIAETFFNGSYRLLHDAVRGIACPALFVFRIRQMPNRSMAFTPASTASPQELRSSSTAPEYPRHGGNWPADFFPMANEQRQDKIIGAKRVSATMLRIPVFRRKRRILVPGNPISRAPSVQSNLMVISSSVKKQAGSSAQTIV